MELYNTFNEIENRNVRSLLLQIQHILQYNIGENNYFTIESLIDILKSNNIEFTKKDLYVVIYILLVNFGNIIRYDSWNLGAKFQVLDERKKDTTWQKAFYSFTDDDNKDKEFILIADTHIGNKEMHNFELINNIYDLALKKKIKNIFHLGDVFEGVKCDDTEDEKYRKLEEQLNLFMNYYPNIDPSELRTISLLGNHDKTIYGTYGTDVLVDFNNMKPQLYDLRSITKDNPGFTFYTRKMFSLKLNDIPMHFSHRLYVNKLYRTVKIQNLSDIEKNVKDAYCDYPLYFSGHLHQGLLYSCNDGWNNKQLFVNVPSTSSLNTGNVVAYIIKINRDEYSKYVNVTTISSTKDNKIYTDKTYTYKIEEYNPVMIENLVMEKQYTKMVK